MNAFSEMQQLGIASGSDLTYLLHCSIRASPKHSTSRSYIRQNKLLEVLVIPESLRDVTPS
jgi:hypothetical protein